MPEAQFRSLVKDAQTKDGWTRVVQRMSLAFASLPPQAVPAAVAEAALDSPDAFEMLVGGPASPKERNPASPKEIPPPGEPSPVEQMENAMGHMSTGDHHQRKKKKTGQDVNLLDKAMPSHVCANAVHNARTHGIFGIQNGIQNGMRAFLASICPLLGHISGQNVTQQDPSVAFTSCKLANESIHAMPSRTNPRQPNNCSLSTAVVKSLLTVTTLLQQILDCGCCAQCKWR